MNVLLLSDDGPDSVGLQVLQLSAQQFFGPNARIVTITVKTPVSGKSFSITPTQGIKGEPYVKYEEIAPYVYIVDGTPMDCLYLAMMFPDHVLGVDKFDVVLSGVNHGHNVGMDVFHSGTVATAMMAASYFGLPSIAFSQELPAEAERNDPESVNHTDYYETALIFVPKILAAHHLSPGTCLNVNFPMGKPKGYRASTVALCSRWLSAGSVKPEPRSDMFELASGFITTTNLELSVIQSASY